MGKTSGITKSQYTNLILMDSYSTPHIGTVYLVKFGIDVSGGCYILGGSLSEGYIHYGYLWEKLVA